MATATQQSPPQYLQLLPSESPSIATMKQRITEHDFVTLQGQNSSTFKKPPLNGSLTIAMLVDWHARYSPDHTWAVYCKENSKDLQNVTWRQLAVAMQSVAAMLLETIRIDPGSTPVIAVLANRDTLTYSALWLGAVRAGFTAFLISPRNSLAGVIHLLKTSKALAILGSSDYIEKKLIDGITAALSIKVIESPVFGEIFDLTIDSSQSYDPVLPDMQPPLDMDSPSLILHSSGSTAYPKQIPLSHMVVIMWSRLPYYGGQDICDWRVGVQAAPPFHAMGFGHVIAYPAASGCVISVFEPQEPPIKPNPDNVLESYKQNKIDIMITPPSNVVEWSKDREAVKYLASVKFVRSTSGPTPSPVGDFLVSQGVRLLNGWGSTETGVLTTTYPSESYGTDWEYIEPPPNTNPIFEPQGEGVFEICLGCSETSTPAVFTDKESRVYRTNDLVEMHPTRKTFFKIVGRTDDQLMLTTGEKTNPGPLESIVQGSPLVKNALYFGRGRFQNGVLIAPSCGNEVDVTDDLAVSSFRNSVWDFVEKANAIAPSHSRIFKEMILVASHKNPFQYTPKGSLSRHRTLKLYEAEIEALYGAIEEVSLSNVKTPSTLTNENASNYVRAVVLEIMRPNGPDLNDDDLFIQGCDSLQASVIRNRLHRALRETMKTCPSLPSNWIYTNSTLPLLIESFYSATRTGSVLNGTSRQISWPETLEALVLKYGSEFPKHTGSIDAPPQHIVLLSGATGTLGCYILDALVKDPKVFLIYAVNRPSVNGSGLERQTTALQDRGIDSSILYGGRVVLVDADLSKPGFGMSDPALFKKMHNSVTRIIHNAWRLDFNLGINSFVPNIESTRYLIDFALSSPYADPPSILFTSSISTIAAHPTGQVEEVSGDPQWVAPLGYAQSKFVAERILEAAPLKTCSIRVGQLSGSRINGAWNVTDWFPMMVKAGEVMGHLPLRPDDVAWLPTDTVAQVIVDLTKTESLPVVAHAVHPDTVKWSEVITSVAKSIDAQVVPYDKWIGFLEKEVDMTKNPAIKLLSYYKARAPVEGVKRGEVETKKTRLLSPALATLSKLSSADTDSWVRYWSKQGFLKGN